MFPLSFPIILHNIEYFEVVLVQAHLMSIKIQFIV